MARTRFWKLSGAGNDFVLVEKRKGLPGPAALAQRLCDRREGVGADGLLLVDGASVEYRNADGSRAFCGNGARCAAWWLTDGRAGATAVFRLSGVPVEAAVMGPRATLRMPDADAPRIVRLSETLSVSFIDTGVPHAVARVSSLEKVPVAALGRSIRRHRAFRPKGTNADFVARKGGRLRLRTYERGVEDETLACGTGAVAAALVSGIESPVTVEARGGTLTVSFTPRKDGGFTDVWLEGPVRLAFTGEVAL